MVFLNRLTLVFILCKLIGAIDWSWFIVLTPLMISFVFALFVSILKVKLDIK